MAETATSATFTRRTVDLALDTVEEDGKLIACAVVDRQSGRVVHRATNQCSQTGDVSAHAGIIAIREPAAAARTVLSGCDIYVTTYPCPMYLGALYNAAPEQIYSAASRDQGRALRGRRPFLEAGDFLRPVR